MSATKQVYLQGERVTFTVADSGYSAVQLRVGGTNVALIMSGGNIDGELLKRIICE